MEETVVLTVSSNPNFHNPALPNEKQLQNQYCQYFNTALLLSILTQSNQPQLTVATADRLKAKSGSLYLSQTASGRNRGQRRGYK